MSTREVTVAAIPAGLPRPSDLTVVERPIPAPGPGEVLVRNRFFTVFAAIRTLLAGVEGAPLPPLRTGDTLFGPAIGEVIASNVDGGPRAGELVRHMLGWREHAVVPVAQCEPVGDVLPDPVAHLAQGLPAYGALTRAARVRPGDTVFVSGGAGSVGSMAGQIARLLGAGRVVGSTGSAWKAERMARLGYDAVVVRGAAPVTEQLTKAAPDGLDIFLDNVGGEDLRAAIAVANRSARFALVGALSGQLAPTGTGVDAHVEIDTYQLILKQIAMAGYSPYGDATVRAEWVERFAAGLRDGTLTFPHVRVAGIDRAPRALHDVLSGRHVGTVVVALE